MRGAPIGFVIGVLGLGIIPADAGSTKASGFVIRGMTDHPRGCGEHFLLIVLGVFEQGSSPRMRGAPANPPCA